ncbi:hypothetical protein ACFV9W_25970 [Streptomyces sp. NPDC059897]|uniref:hypothetical protein n=1 Tax=Streptomyces sp. NPDC059897 TaxID=3346994 RepID=UPI00364EFE86
MTDEWLRHQYVDRHRTTKEIAEELRCHNAYVSHLLKRANIPTQPLFAVYSPFARLDVPLSPAMEAVTRLRNHVARLRNILLLPGHHDIADACRSQGLADSSAYYQLNRMEEAVGFTIIDRVDPLTVTPEGGELLTEAQKLLTLLDTFDR